MLLFIFSSAIFLCIYPTHSKFLLSRPTNLRVSYSSDPTLVNIVWSSPEESEGVITGYTILYTDDSLLNDIKWKRIKVFEPQTTIFLTQLTPDSNYFLKIKPIIDGKQLGPPSDVIKIITKTFLPNSHESFSLYTPKILKVVAGKDSSMAEIIWKSPGITKAIVKRYEIYYTTDEMKLSPKWSMKIIENVRGFNDIHDASIYNLVPDTNYKFVIKVKTYGNNDDAISSVFEFRTIPLISNNTKNIFYNIYLYYDYLSQSIYDYLYGYIISILGFFLKAIICLSAPAFLYIWIFIRNNFFKKIRTEYIRPETERERTQNNNESTTRERLIMQYRVKATLFMSLGMFEDAVRIYEWIYYLDPSIENEDLLEDAKIKLKISKQKDYYKILGVVRTAGMEEIKKAYRDLALKHHPDKYAGVSESKKKEQERLMKDINEAYDVLKDPIKRYDYDNMRRNVI